MIAAPVPPTPDVWTQLQGEITLAKMVATVFGAWLCYMIGAGKIVLVKSWERWRIKIAPRILLLMLRPPKFVVLWLFFVYGPATFAVVWLLVHVDRWSRLHNLPSLPILRLNELAVNRTFREYLMVAPVVAAFFIVFGLFGSKFVLVFRRKRWMKKTATLRKNYCADFGTKNASTFLFSDNAFERQLHAPPHDESLDEFVRVARAFIRRHTTHKDRTLR